MNIRSSPAGFLRLAFAAVLVATLAACNGSSSGSGALTVGVTDTPVDGVSQVVVAFTGIELMGPDGTVNYSLSSEQQINLLSYQGRTISPFWPTRRCPPATISGCVSTSIPRTPTW